MPRWVKTTSGARRAAGGRKWVWHLVREGISAPQGMSRTACGLDVPSTGSDHTSPDPHYHCRNCDLRSQYRGVPPVIPVRRVE